MEAKDYRLLLIGSSYVKRLQEYIHVNKGWPAFWVRGAHVDFLGQSGGRVDSVRTMVQETMETKKGVFDMGCLVLGGNDLCMASASPEVVAKGLIDLAQTLIVEYGLKKVIICEIIHRKTQHSRMEIPLAEFNLKVEQLNAILQENLKIDGNICFWLHKPDVTYDKSYHADGTHFSSFGQGKFLSSLRRGFWCHLQQALGIVPRTIHVEKTE